MVSTQMGDRLGTPQTVDKFFVFGCVYSFCYISLIFWTKSYEIKTGMYIKVLAMHVTVSFQSTKCIKPSNFRSKIHNGKLGGHVENFDFCYSQQGGFPLRCRNFNMVHDVPLSFFCHSIPKSSQSYEQALRYGPISEENWNLFHNNCIFNELGGSPPV